MENPIKMDDLGVPLFFGNTHITDSDRWFSFELLLGRRDGGLDWTVPLDVSPLSDRYIEAAETGPRNVSGFNHLCLCKNHVKKVLEKSPIGEWII